MAQWQNARDLRERLIVRGNLVLQTPAHIGNGDSDSPLDMPLLLDETEGHALLPGTSIAGALRSYLAQHDERLAEHLFGTVRGSSSQESKLIVDDARAEQFSVELRDGVAIDSATRTAEDKKKFDIELLAPGTTFPLRFELLVPRKEAEHLRQGLELTLSALQRGDLALGKRKRRGFGRCTVSRWTVIRYDMTTPQGLVAWLDGTGEPQEGKDLATLLNVEAGAMLPRTQFRIHGTFDLDGSLLIRAGAGAHGGPDMVHLRSGGKPIVSGTSLAGALRARALRISNTLGKDGTAIANHLFGYRPTSAGDREALTASRVWVEESIVEEPLSLVQNRVKIDRFTGGTFPGALFSQAPLFGAAATRIQLRFTLHDAQDAEKGLLLLLLKDLWTGDLTLGGESSVGRGQLRGREATIQDGSETWTIQQQEGTLKTSGAERLEEYVQTFYRWSPVARNSHASN